VNLVQKNVDCVLIVFWVFTMLHKAAILYHRILVPVET